VSQVLINLMLETVRLTELVWIRVTGGTPERR